MTSAAYVAEKRSRTMPAKRSGYRYVPRTPGGLMVTERKYFDSYLAATALPASTDWTGTEFDPTANSLFTPVEGSDLDNRIGRLVHVHKIQVRGMITCTAQANQTATDSAATIRLILVMDQQTNGSQMQGEQLMASPGAADSRLCVNTFQSPANFGRFRVLKDKTFNVQDPNIAYDGTNMEQQGINRPFKFTLKFAKPIPVRFNNTNGGTIADIVDNSFHMLANASGITLAPNILYEARFVYTDK